MAAQKVARKANSMVAPTEPPMVVRWASLMAALTESRMADWMDMKTAANWVCSTVGCLAA